jgi:hypothetical protein
MAVVAVIVIALDEVAAGSLAHDIGLGAGAVSSADAGGTVPLMNYWPRLS